MYYERRGEESVIANEIKRFIPKEFDRNKRKEVSLALSDKEFKESEDDVSSLVNYFCLNRHFIIIFLFSAYIEDGICCQLRRKRNFYRKRCDITPGGCFCQGLIYFMC